MADKQDEQQLPTWIALHKTTLITKHGYVYTEREDFEAGDAVYVHEDRYNKLREAAEALVGFVTEAAILLDEDKDMKCLKLLLAIEGRAPGYRADVDAVRAALEKE